MGILPTVLIVEDEEIVRESYRRLLGKTYRTLTAGRGKEALELARREHVDLVLLDIMMPDMSGIDVLKCIKEAGDTEVIMVTGDSTARTAIQAMKLGAYDYLEKPIEVDELLATVQKALERLNLAREVVCLRSELQSVRFGNMVGESAPMQALYTVISQVGDNLSTVLITGESGTGKELTAHAIHQSGPRRDKPFVAVDCATIPESLVESELFGHEKGAFTDATEQKIGKLEMSNHGTLFLDEISNLSQDVQCKILRVLEEREIQRVGGTRTIPIDTRVIAATNVDLGKAVKNGTFRQDLYYRLNVIPITVPPLRERSEDIPLLVEHFRKQYTMKFGKDIRGVSEDAMAVLKKYSWPGNVRELRNVVERLVALGKESLITRKSLPLDILLSESEKPQDCYDNASLRDARGEFEKNYILKVLERVNWNQSKAAQLLGIHRNALLYKVQQLNIRPIMKESKAKQPR